MADRPCGPRGGAYLPRGQFRDGDNWGDADNHRCVDLVRDLLAGSAAVGYGEIAESGYQSPLLAAFAEVGDPRFVAVSMHDRKDIYSALKRFFPGEGEEG